MSGAQTPCAESQTQPECCFQLTPSPSSGPHHWNKHDICVHNVPNQPAANVRLYTWTMSRRWGITVTWLELNCSLPSNKFTSALLSHVPLLIHFHSQRTQSIHLVLFRAFLCTCVCWLKACCTWMRINKTQCRFFPQDYRHPEKHDGPVCSSAISSKHPINSQKPCLARFDPPPVRNAQKNLDVRSQCAD